MKNKLLLLLCLLGCLECYASKWTEAGNYDTSWYDDLSNEYYISTNSQLAGMAYLGLSGKNFAGKTINIMADIDMGAHEWEMFNGFSGVLNGNGYSILNLNYNSEPIRQYTSNPEYHFSFIKTINANGKINDIDFKNVNFSLVFDAELVEGNAYIGGVAIYNYGSINNCKISGIVYVGYSNPNTGYNNDCYYAGGIVASNHGSIKNCVHDGSVRVITYYYDQYKSAYAGGIAGTNNGSIINSINYGEVYARVHYDLENTLAYAGGICALNEGMVNNVINMANVTAEEIEPWPEFGLHAYAGGVIVIGNCDNSYYSSEISVIAPLVIDSGTMLSPQKVRNIDFAFTSLLNTNLQYLQGYEVVPWANSATINENIPFLLNCFAIRTEVNDVKQNSAVFVANPKDITSSAIASKGFEYKLATESIYKKVFCEDEFEVSVTDLESAKDYVVHAFANLTNGTVIYGDDVQFVTPQIQVETLQAIEISGNSAILCGSVQAGTTSIKSQGFLWKSEEETNYHIVYVEGSDFQYKLVNLLPSSRYFYQAFILTSNGDSFYGELQNFTTNPVAISVSNYSIDCNSLFLAGDINISISTTVTIEYKETNESSYKKVSVQSNNEGHFECTLTDLLPNTYYDCRAFIIYNNIYIYSPTYTYKTMNVTVQTLTPLLSEYIILRGEVLGGVNTAIVGFEYRDANYPDMIESDYINSSLNGTSFTAVINNVENNKEYKYRAYYEYGEAITYGEWVYFTPTDVIGTGIGQVDSSLQASKILRNGQIYIILPDGSRYNIMGQRR